MVHLIQRIRSNVFSVNNWSTENELKELIKGHLDEVVQMGEDEGSAAAVVSQFVRRVSSDESDESGNEAEQDQADEMNSFIRTQVSDIDTSDTSVDQQDDSMGINRKVNNAPTE